MTREEAIAYGKRVIDLGLNDETQAFCEMAIKALEQEPKTGHWISDLTSYGYGKDDYHCSICGRTIRLCRPQEELTDYPYCHCGAKMVEPQESEEI